MGQPRAPRLAPRDPAQGLFQMAVGYMRLAADAIDRPDLDPGERRERGLVELDHVGRIGESAEAETGGFGKAVVLGKRRDADAGGVKGSGNRPGPQERLLINRSD